MASILYATDIHGRKDVVDRLVKAGNRKSIDAVIIGGDMTPGFDVFLQRSFIEFCLIPKLSGLSGEGKQVFVQMGNDDFGVNMDLLEKAEKEGVLKVTHMKKHVMGKFEVMGYSCVNPFPFLFKEWERSEDDIRNDLEKIFEGSDKEKSIFVFHAPPHGTKLDIIHGGENMGSRSVREFIEKEQPLLTLHGHIHESAEISGSIKDRIGRTLCVNPGPGIIALIDLEKMTVGKVK